MAIRVFKLRRVVNFQFSLFIVVALFGLFFANAAYAGDRDTLHQLSDSEKAKFISTKFAYVSKTKALPESVQEAIGVLGKPESMADVGGRWSVGCVGSADVPHQRLISAGTSADRCFVYFERGGIAHFQILRLYDVSGKSAELVWESRASKRFGDVDAIKDAMKKGELQ